MAAERAAAVHQMQQVWAADRRTAVMAENLDWEPMAMVSMLAPYVWDLALEQVRQGVEQPSSGRQAELVAQEVTKRAQQVGVSRLGAIAFTVRTTFVTEEGAPRGGTGIDLRLPQPKFFTEASIWVQQYVLDAWLARSDLQDVIGTYATITYGDDSDESRRKSIVDGCRASLHIMWRQDNLYAGDFHDWEWAHWVAAKTLAEADGNDVATVLSLGVQEQRTLNAHP